MKEEFGFTQYLLNISTNLFIKINSEGIISYSNAKADMLFGTSNLVGTNIKKLFSEKNYNLLQNKIKEVGKTQSAAHTSIEYKSRNYMVYLYPHGEEQVLCIDDITERVQLSNTLRRTSERLEFAEKTTKLGYWEFDLNSKYLFWSAEMYRLFGLDAQKVSHKTNIIRSHIVKEDYPLYKEKLRELVTLGLPVEGNIRIKRADGKILFCSFKAGLICDCNCNKIAGIFQDLTQLIETQFELEQAKKEAEASDKAKSYFIAQASHDLRQPMQALKIFINTLSEEHLSKNQRNILDKLSASADNLNNLLDNLMDISKLDSHGFAPHNYGFDIAELLKNIIFEFKEIAHKRHIKFVHSFCHYTVHSDPLLVERVVRNLLSNAFKYTKNKVLIGCKKEKSHIRIVVMDNGAGISKKELKLIYNEFYQSENIPDNQRNGTGLGLSIVKKISDVLDLDIKVKSELGHGANFSFRLPLIKCPHK